MSASRNVMSAVILVSLVLAGAGCAAQPADEENTMQPAAEEPSPTQAPDSPKAEPECGGGGFLGGGWAGESWGGFPGGGWSGGSWGWGGFPGSWGWGGFPGGFPGIGLPGGWGWGGFPGGGWGAWARFPGWAGVGGDHDGWN